MKASSSGKSLYYKNGMEPEESLSERCRIGKIRLWRQGAPVPSDQVKFQLLSSHFPFLNCLIISEKAKTSLNKMQQIVQSITGTEVDTFCCQTFFSKIILSLVWQ